MGNPDIPKRVLCNNPRQRATFLISCVAPGLGIFSVLSHLISQLTGQAGFVSPTLGMEKQGPERSKVTVPSPKSHISMKGRKDSSGEAPFH